MQPPGPHASSHHFPFTPSGPLSLGQSGAGPSSVVSSSLTSHISHRTPQPPHSQQWPPQMHHPPHSAHVPSNSPYSTNPYSATFPPSTSAMPSYPSYYPPPALHSMPPQSHHMAYPPPPPLGYPPQPATASPISALTAPMGAVRPHSVSASVSQQAQPSGSLYAAHTPTFANSAPVFASPATDPFRSPGPVPAKVQYQPYPQPHMAHAASALQQQRHAQQAAMASFSSSVLSGSSPSSSGSSPFGPRAVGSAPALNISSSERKRKRKRAPAPERSASTGNAVGRRSSGGSDHSSASGSMDDKEKEEKTDSESDEPGGALGAVEQIQSLHDAGRGGGAGGLGQYELELLQREVDELHDEAMAERTRADEVEDRHIRLLQKGRQLAAKCAQLDVVLQAALAVAVPEPNSENKVLLRWDIQLSVLYAEMKGILGDLVDASLNESEQAVHSARSTAPASSVAHARLSRFLSKSAGERFCKPCRLITTLSKRPFRVLLVDVQRQYTMSKKETRRMTKEEKERLVSVPLRIMGSPNRNNLYFVAKDVCILIHTRKGNVAKSIGQFSEKQKARMPVLCVRSNGTVSTHILTVLTVEGVQRLLGASRSVLAPQVLSWILQQVEVVCGDNPPDPTPSTANTAASSPSSSSSSTSPSGAQPASAPP